MHDGSSLTPSRRFDLSLAAMNDPASSSSSASSTSSTARGASRQFDVVLYGATGFVGRQTVAYFASHPDVKASGLRWALAGRDAGKLERVRAATPGAERAGVVVASADDMQHLTCWLKAAQWCFPLRARSRCTAAHWWQPASGTAHTMWTSPVRHPG